MVRVKDSADKILISKLCKKMERNIKKRKFKKALTIAEDIQKNLFGKSKKRKRTSTKRNGNNSKSATVRSVRQILTSTSSAEMKSEPELEDEQIYKKHVQKKKKCGLKLS